MNSNDVAINVKSITERIIESSVFYPQSKTTRSGAKDAARSFKKLKNFNPDFQPEKRDGHLFPSVKDLCVDNYSKAVEKVSEALRAKKYNVRFLVGINIEPKVEHTASEALQIKLVVPEKNETIAEFSKKCDNNVRQLGLLELLHFILIEEVSSEREVWVLCPGDKDFGVKSNLEHVPLVKIRGKEVVVLPTPVNHSYQYPLGMLVEVNK